MSVSMEYLTLQDIPHRHYDPLHSSRMASSQTIEKPLGMADAVSQTYESPLSPLSLAVKLALSRPIISMKQEARTERPASPCQHGIDRERSSHGLHHHHHHHHHTMKHSFVPLAYPDRQLPVPALLMDKYTICPEEHSYRNHLDVHPRFHNTRFSSKEEDLSQYAAKNTNVIQNHHMRHSPPIQPGEPQQPDKLPSFSEVSFSVAAA
jgi:hypothetical protein